MAPGGVAQNGEQVYLVLFGTGLRNASTDQMTAGLWQVIDAGPAPGVDGLDQVKLLVPANLGQFTLVPITVGVAGASSNTVHVTLK